MGKPKVWRLQEAKTHFDELFQRTRTEGPQRVEKQRGEAVVIVPAEDYDRDTDRARQPQSILEFFQSAPGGSELDLRRKRDSTRDIKW